MTVEPTKDRGKGEACTYIAEGLRHLAVPIETLVPDAANARRHGPRNMEAIKASLARWGQRQPIVVQRKGMVVRAGNGRLEAAKAIGWTHIAAIIVDDESADAVAFAIADNRTAELAEWDTETLATLLDTLPQEVKVDTGFTDADLAAMLNDLTPTITEDTVPEPPSDPITKPGDLWLLGDHRLLCGDSTKADDVERLMAGAKADMLLSDPPYGVSYVGKTKDALKVENDALGEEDLTALVVAAFDNAEANCRAGAYWYATVPPGPLHILFADDWKRRGILRQIMVWAKDSMVLGHSEYHYQHEPILFGWMPGDRHKNSDRTRTTLWQYDRPKASREHPTMKPVALWAQAVNDGSRQGEIIYDPFLGSGTTIIAAEQLGRKCYGMEISPQYCDVIVKRWETLTGKKATLENP
jgi:site-specific DNA-methyltransferase (adenine-specific)